MLILDIPTDIGIELKLFDLFFGCERRMGVGVIAPAGIVIGGIDFFIDFWAWFNYSGNWVTSAHSTCSARGRSGPGVGRGPS